jgi:hypothetical protein
MNATRNLFASPAVPYAASRSSPSSRSEADKYYNATTVHFQNTSSREFILQNVEISLPVEILDRPHDQHGGANV